MKATLVDVNLLQENPENPRTITDGALNDLVKSILEFPQMLELRPIVHVDWVVQGGNQRLKACKKAGLKEVWAIDAKELTEEQRRRFVILDNIPAGSWNWEKIRLEWPEVMDWGLKIPDWVLKKNEVKDDNYQMPKTVKTDIKPGDLIEIGQHRLICGDSTKPETITKLMDGKLADLLITDPHYNVDYTGGTGMKIINDNMSDAAFYQFLLDAFRAAAEGLRKGAAAYIWHADSEGLNFRRAFIDAGFEFKQNLIWNKNSFVMGRQDYQWKHEPCLYGWKAGAAHYFTSDRNNATVIEDQVDMTKLKKEQMLKMLQELLSDNTPTTVLNYDKPSKNELHPTMKPVKLIANLVQNSSQNKQLVLDTFGGSGTTMVAAHQLGRQAFLVEMDPKFCHCIVDRMKDLEPGITIIRNGKPVKK